MNIDQRWMAFAVLASLFLSGVAVGATGVLLVRGPSPGDRSPPVAPFERSGGLGAPPVVEGTTFIPERTIRQLVAELELNPAQADSVRAILQRQRDAAREELAVLAPRLRASLDSAAAQIRRVLDERQKVRFDSMDGLTSPDVSPGGPQIP